MRGEAGFVIQVRVGEVEVSMRGAVVEVDGNGMVTFLVNRPDGSDQIETYATGIRREERRSDVRRRTEIAPIASP